MNHNEELTTYEIVDAFEQIASDFDMSQFRHINITGGEPFVRNDLLDVLRKLSKRPFYRNIDIQTNGIILADHPEFLEELKQYGVTGIGISMMDLKKHMMYFVKCMEVLRRRFVLPGLRLHMVTL